MSTIEAFRAIKSLGLKPPRLGYLESVSQWTATDDTVSLRVERVKGWEAGYSGRDFRVTHRGVTIYSWSWIDGAWVPLKPFTLWNEVNELITSTPSRSRDAEWEEICHRPGTSDFPLDNTDRKAQGYTYK